MRQRSRSSCRPRYPPGTPTPGARIVRALEPSRRRRTATGPASPARSSPRSSSASGGVQCTPARCTSEDLQEGCCRSPWWYTDARRRGRRRCRRRRRRLPELCTSAEGQTLMLSHKCSLYCTPSHCTAEPARPYTHRLTRRHRFLSHTPRPPPTPAVHFRRRQTLMPSYKCSLYCIPSHCTAEPARPYTHRLTRRHRRAPHAPRPPPTPPMPAVHFRRRQTLMLSHKCSLYCIPSHCTAEGLQEGCAHARPGACTATLTSTHHTHHSHHSHHHHPHCHARCVNERQR